MEFVSEFPNEETCMNWCRALKEKQGITCPNCGHTDFRWLPYRRAHEGIHCGRRVTLKAGTMLAHSILPFYAWFLTLHLMTSTKIPLSVVENQGQI